MSLIIEPRPDPTSLEKHLATLQRMSTLRERTDYIVQVSCAEGEGPAAELHLAYLAWWTASVRGKQ